MANTDSAGCDTCKRNGRTCYGGSNTQKCTFCSATRALCSRVKSDAIIKAGHVERKQLQLAQRSQNAVQTNGTYTAAAGATHPPETIATNLQPAPQINAQDSKCTRCKKLNKQCIGGSATERCALCKTKMSLCSKNDIDREKLIQWGRYHDESPDPKLSQLTGVSTPASEGPLPASVYSKQHHSRLQVTNAEPAIPVENKRKRTYTYKAKEAVRDTAASNPDEPFDYIFRTQTNGTVDSSNSPAPQVEGLSLSNKKSRPPAFSDPQRLCIAIALFDTLFPGLEGGAPIIWGVITHALAFKYEQSVLERRWRFQRESSLNFVEKLKQALQEPLLTAYENGEIAAIDYEDLSRTDWPGLVRWVESNILPLDEPEETPLDLPQTRDELHANFEILSALQDGRKRDRAYDKESASNSTNMIHAKSFVRAVTMTNDEVYNIEAAKSKLSTLKASVRNEAIEQLKKSHTILRRKEGRQLPGRNYVIHKDALSQFARWHSRDNEDDFMFLRKVAEAWTRFTRHFLENERSTIDPSASEADRLVITNMVAQGHLKMRATIPALDKEMLQKMQKDPLFTFPVEYTITSKFTTEHNLNKNVLIPSEPPAPLTGAIPFWVDIHGNLIHEVWDMVLRSVLHVLLFSSGSTAEGMEKAHKNQLWNWEIEMVLQWMEKVGVAEKGGDGDKDGWRPTEWWYLAFAEEVATWKVPAGAMGRED